jgi:PAS domain S-box-containing protein
METGRSRPLWGGVKLNSPFHTVILVCLVAMLSYLAPKLAGALLLHPQTVWPLWPGCALLVSVLMLIPRRIWPIIIPVAFAAFALYDMQAGVPIGSIAWFIAADTVQVLTAAFCLGHFFDGVPRLNSVTALSKYLFFAVLLAPFAAAFLSAFGIHGDYWTSWRISFFSEVLAFATLTPAILGWVSNGPEWVRKPRAYLLEFAALIAGLVFLGYITFTASESSSSPALFYSLLPFLLWAALRFGSMGVSTSVIVVTFLSIWGVIHGRGPFTAGGPLNSVLSLQLFLVFAATPFMVLAALVEERKQAEEELRKSEERFRLAAQAGKMFAYEWDATSDVIVRSEESAQILGVDETTRITGQQIFVKVHPDDRERLTAAVAELSPEKPYLEIRYRMVRPDGVVTWVERNSRAHFDEQGRMLRIVGMVTDITERKRAEEALSSLSRRLIEAQEQERARIARELHDDVSQRMALLQIALEQFQLDTAGFSSKARQQLREIAEVSTEVSSSIHDLSHQLHPSKLDTLGLEASIRGFCREFSQQHSLEVQFVCHDVPGQILKDVTLCLFRIVQEALRNVVKHSGAADAKVELSGHGERIDLCISDSGVGFDAGSAEGESGLGLISMRERLRLVGGHLSVESEPSCGTRIRVHIPLPAADAPTTSEGKAHKARA